ncbi:MAG: type II toxin-antitoxin system VapC family toxin [Thermomicrobiales bacterium]
MEHQSGQSSHGDDGPRVAFVDSSAIVAMVDRDDANHTAAVEAYRDLVTHDYRLFTTNHVVDETFDLLSVGVGPMIARRWLREFKLPIYHVSEEEEQLARRMLTRGNSPQVHSFTDATTRVIMDRLGVTDAFVVDPNVLAESP